MPRLAHWLRPASAALACLLYGLAAPAQAAPSDDIIEILESPEFAETFVYDRVTETDAGVAIHGLALSPAALAALGMALPEAITGTPETGSAAVVTIETLRLGPGAIDALLGTDSAPPLAPFAIGIDGFEIDLAALAADPGMAAISTYLGGADAVAGHIEIRFVSSADRQRDMIVTADLTGVGRFAMDLTIDDPDEPPSGRMTFVDTAGHGVAGLMALVVRTPLEQKLRFATETLESIRAHPSFDPDADDPGIAMLEDQVAEAEAQLARIPTDGPGAAAAMAAWARETAAALPEHAALFEAVALYAENGGTLHLDFAPQPNASIPMEAAFEFSLFDQIEAVTAIIEALGISAAYEDAG